MSCAPGFNQFGMPVDDVSGTTPPVANRPGFSTGQKTVAVSGTAEQLPVLAIPDGFSLVIKAKNLNTGQIQIGNSAVNAQSAVDCFTLEADEVVELYITNADLVWIDATVAGEGVEFITES